MISCDFARDFAQDWVDSWNSHDLERTGKFDGVSRIIVLE